METVDEELLKATLDFMCRRILRSTTSSRRWLGCRPSRRRRAPDIKEKLLQGYSADGKSFKVHLDGYNQRDLFAGKGPDKRREFFYWTDDGNLAGLRYDQYKAVFMEQPAHGLEVWMQPLVPLRRAQAVHSAFRPVRARRTRGRRLRQMVHRASVCLVSGASDCRETPQSFQEFPPRQKPGSFSVDEAMEMLMNRKGSN